MPCGRASLVWNAFAAMSALGRWGLAGTVRPALFSLGRQPTAQHKPQQRPQRSKEEQPDGGLGHVRVVKGGVGVVPQPVQRTPSVQRSQTHLSVGNTWSPQPAAQRPDKAKESVAPPQRLSEEQPRGGGARSRHKCRPLSQLLPAARGAHKAAAHRMAARAAVLAGQLQAAEQGTGLSLAPTSSHAAAETPMYSVALPERLTPDGPWRVYR
jgi:hypothetical protein